MTPLKESEGILTCSYSQVNSINLGFYIVLSDLYRRAESRAPENFPTTRLQVGRGWTISICYGADVFRFMRCPVAPLPFKQHFNLFFGQDRFNRAHM
jgi:hypothetical protein